jgi:hypothetical protein
MTEESKYSSLFDKYIEPSIDENSTTAAANTQVLPSETVVLPEQTSLNSPLPSVDTFNTTDNTTEESPADSKHKGRHFKKNSAVKVIKRIIIAVLFIIWLAIILTCIVGFLPSIGELFDENFKRPDFLNQFWDFIKGLSFGVLS